MPTSFEHYYKRAEKLSTRELVTGVYTFFDMDWIEKFLRDLCCEDCDAVYEQGDDGFCDCDSWIYDDDCRMTLKVRDFFRRMWAFEEMIAHEF